MPDINQIEALPPSPGSDAAIALGCTCPVLDNGHGRGYMGQPGIYVYMASCPVHWPAGTKLGPFIAADDAAAREPSP